MADKPKGVANVTRQTWDREHYEKLAKLRASGQLEKEAEEKKVIRSNKPEFRSAEADATKSVGVAGALLKARSQRVALDENVGTARVVKGEDAAKTSGFYCEVCECALKDSVAYVDHLNGKRHLQKLGFSMRVERSTVDQVKNRLKVVAKRKYDPVMTKKLDALEEYERNRRELEEEEERKKRQKKEQRKKKNKATTDTTAEVEAIPTFPFPVEDDTVAADDSATNNEEDSTATEDADAAMMAMMGFGGFGGSNKS